MVSTGLKGLDGLLGGAGYPAKSAVVVVGPPGMGKEALGYWFLRAGLSEGDYCVYMTRLSVSEVKQDIQAFHADENSEPIWVASDGGQIKLDINDLVGISSTLKEVLRTGAGKRRVRVVIDVLSSLLMLNPPETVYRFLVQLFAEVKQNYDAVVVATVEEGMHTPQALAAMEQLFDGALELTLYQKGLRVIPLLRVVKMRGLPPQPGFFRYNFVDGKMEIEAYVR